MLAKNKIQLILIGSITHSTPIYPDGTRDRYGGGIMYGCKTATQLGIRTEALVIGAEDIKPSINALEAKGIKVHHIKRPQSNNFANDYTHEPRKLQMRSIIKSPISKDEIKHIAFQGKAVLLYPIYHEISSKILDCFDKTQPIMLDGQGFTRKALEKTKDGYYPIVQTHWEDIDSYRNKITILKLSDDDISNISFPKKFNIIEKIKYLSQRGFPTVVLTRGDRSVLIARKNFKTQSIPTYSVDVLDSGGAGDTFGVGFMVEYVRSKDPLRSTAFGNACASFKVRGEKYDYKMAQDRMKEILIQYKTQQKYT